MRRPNGGRTHVVSCLPRPGAAANDADDRIIYDPISGALYFDADGIGGAAEQQFASLAAGLLLTSMSFFVF